MRKISPSQRRARLAHRHFLAEPADDAREVTRRLVAIHSTDPATVFLSMWARVDGFRVGDLEELLYEERSLVRHWAMRRTLWVVDRDILPLVVSASTRPIGDKERRRTAKIIEDGGLADDGERWLRAAIEETLALVRERGEVLARDLSKEVPRLAEKIEFTNKAGEVVGTTGMSSRTLVQLGMESRVIRARPAGTWVSGQYRWAETEDWLGGPIEEVPSREASAKVVRGWLRAYGPGTENDIRWWSGWPVGQVRTALHDAGVVEVDLGADGVGYVLADDIDDVEEPGPWVALLPSLDTTVMGWKDRDWYLGDHEERLFDRNGNAGPTVWADGRVVGGWAQRGEAEVAYELCEDVGSEITDLIQQRRDELQAWLGRVTVTPRFRSPHDKALSA